MGPFNGEEFRHYQFLYLPADIAGSGNIASIYFRYYENSQALSCPRVTIRLGHSSVSALNTDMTSNVNQGKGSAVTVLDRAVSIPAGAAGEYFEIPLDTRFNYNGVDNLVVDITRTSACTGGVRLITGAGAVTYTGRVYSTSSATPDTATQTSQSPHHVKFKFAGGDNPQNYGGAGTNTWPFATVPLRTQTLYLASNINGSGRITGIAFQLNDVSVAGTYTYSMRMAHTTLSALGTIFADNYSGNPVTVANNVTFSVPAGIPAGEWFWAPVPNDTFTYNGRDNLIVEVATTAGTGGSESLRVATGTAGVRVWANGATSESGSSSIPVVHHIKLRFAGGTMDTVFTSNSNANVFPTSISGRQFLLRASELGTAGYITRIALRSFTNATTTASYPDYSITLAHTDQGALVADDATNIAGGSVVYTGTFTMQAGLLAGDWIEIPLSTPFHYNGYSNLVVQTSSGAGTASRSCTISTSATRFIDMWKATGGAS